jgi:hypothetical protein
MKKNISSYNSSIEFRDNLFPGMMQLIFCTLLAIILLAILNGRAIWTYLTTGLAPNSTVDLGSVINRYAPWTYKVFDFVTHGRVSQMLFWVFVGCVAYMLIWLGGNVLTNIRNDIVADAYVHPKFYNRSGYWSSILSRKVFFVCLMIIFLIFLYTFGRLAQVMANLTFQSIADFEVVRSLLTIAGSILGLAVLIYCLTLLLRIIRNTWRYIYKDL